MKKFKELSQELNESGGGLSRIQQHAKDRNIGTITAHRGNLSAEENNKRNNLLKADIKANEFGYKHIKGKYIENYGKEYANPVEEKSFLVIGKKGHDKDRLKNFLVKHGEKYDQDSVLYKAHDSDEAYLIGTGSGYPEKGATASVGKFHPDKVAEFHSTHKGKNYTFESIEFYDEGYSKTFLNRTGKDPELIESYHYSTKK